MKIFGSEIKAIVPSVRSELTVNENILKTFLNLGYCLEPYSIYNEINCVNPGNVVIIKEGRTFKHDLTSFNFESSNKYSYRENTELSEEKLKTAVERNLIADVEVAVALSGGIDSSLIYAFANKINSRIKGLTIKFDDEE